MARRCDICPFSESDGFTPSTQDERDVVKLHRVGELQVDAGRTILDEGTNPQRFFTLLEGQALRYKTLEDGRRQVLNFLFPGDLIGLEPIMLGETAHTVETLSPVTLCVFDRNQIWQMFSQMPERAFMLTWQVAREEHFLGEALVAVGQRSARESLAWAFVSLWDRGAQSGLVRDGFMPFPVRQQDLADALGLSLVHTNKTLSRLRTENLVIWRDGLLSLPDRAALAKVGLVDETHIRKRIYL
ncbi:Crp/Fnr family transcriptional regulator [Thioclava sp. BHET1]|uniref:Crp/Fnr family transcriptional regulator n=1 Tax=Thioclava dalianensis TaxID=1185766 RepID=A0A074TLR2_9RHOB|nr:Crp/Fnr family transcriptional regulator [Thioclava dalianensis]KEP69928.1 Crp/Fnr family transcriptional regulator [Thioclava dalianensis]TMV92341.1 Crp/Fnr family transcriptional regulator [Thioclava sp. BHET1]SFN17550.1 cAMP-binding domain of CRP or a regulatory subunit of cAMP-dependent protein kinases [Thioclava dalianensis]